MHFRKKISLIDKSEKEKSIEEYKLEIDIEASDGLATFLSIVKIYPLPNLFFRKREEPQHCNFPFYFIIELKTKLKTKS